MLNFIFFNAGIRDRVVDYLKSLQLACTLRHDHFGWVVVVPVSPDIASRLMAHLEEIHSLFSTVARSALYPSNDPICKM